MFQALPDEKLEGDKTKFSHDELIAALLEAQDTINEDSDVMTSTELGEIIGFSTKTVIKRLRPMIAAGKVEVAPKQIINLIGTKTTVMGYRLVD